MRLVCCHFALIAALLQSRPSAAETPAPPPSIPAPTPARASAAPASAGSTPLGLSLEQVIARFRRENLKLLAARYDVAATRADVISAGLLPNPSLFLSGGFHVHGEVDSASRQYSVSLTQSLPLWGRLAASQQAAELSANASERSFAAASWQLLGELRHAYLGLQLAAERRFVLGAGLSDLERVQRVLEARIAAGANPVYDQVRLEVERGTLRGRIAQADLDLSNARSELAALIGGPVAHDELAASDPLAEPDRETREPAALVRHALAHRHELAAMRLEMASVGAQLRALHRRNIPEPELGIGYTRSSGIPGAPAGAVGGALLLSAAIPLPVFDRGQGAIQRKLAESRAGDLRQRDLSRSIEREVDRAARALNMTSTAYFSYQEEAARNAESVRKVAELTYREGRGTILELLDAYASYLRVEEQALELRGTALHARIDLEQSLGPWR